MNDRPADKRQNITPAMERDELKARELAQRWIELSRHCEEALYHNPDEPLFSADSLFKAEAERTKKDKTTKYVTRRAVEIFKELLAEDEAQKKRICATWKKRLEELKRGDFIDRHAESKAFFEAHRNDPDGGRGAVDEYRDIVIRENEREHKDIFYHVTPKTEKPKESDWWHLSRKIEELEREYMTCLAAIKNINQTEENKPKHIPNDIDKLSKILQSHMRDQDCSTITNQFLWIAKRMFGEEQEDEIRESQLKRASQWMLEELENGNEPSIPQAAAEFGNMIQAEISKGGYSSVDSLRTALYKHADELGLSQFKKRTK